MEGIAIPGGEADGGIAFLARVVGLAGNRIGLPDHIHAAAARYGLSVGDDARTRRAADLGGKIFFWMAGGDSLRRHFAAPGKTESGAARKTGQYQRGWPPDESR